MSLLDPSVDTKTAPTWQKFLGHYAVAVFGSMLLGFIPEAVFGGAYANTRLSAFPPFILLSAAVVGYLLNRRFGHRAALWVWVLGFYWLLLGVWDLSRHWSPAWDYHPTRWSFAAANLFGPDCGDTECLWELLVTYPFAASVVYSVFALIGLRSFRAKLARCD